MRLPPHAYWRSPDGWGPWKKNGGFRDYEYKRGDTREAIWETIKFFWEMANQSTGLKIAVAVVAMGILGEVSGVNEKIRNDVSKVLIGEKNN